MALNFGPVPMNFEALGSLGKTFFDAQAAAQKRGLDQQKQQLLANLGQGSGDYQKVGLGLIGAGDVQSGVALLGLAQKDREQKLAEEAYKTSPFSAAPRAPGAPTVPLGSDPSASLIQNESGGRWNAQNNAVGAGGKVGHFGRLQFSQARLEEAKAAGILPPDVTPQTFMASPELQQRAEAWHFSDIDNAIKQNGYDRLVGRATIGGVPITVEGLRAVAHLGGKDGMRKFVETQGAYNPADVNGTRLSDYFARHGGGGQPAQAAPVQVAENEADVQRLEAQMPGYGGAPVQVADVPAPGAVPAQGFVVPPGQTGKLPPNDPFPQVTNEQLIQVIRNPRSSPGDKALAQQLFASRQAYASETAPEKREQTRLETRKKDLEVQKLERELAGAEPIPLTAEERQKFGIAPDQAAYRTRDGIKFGPAGTKIINEAQKLQSAEDKARVDVNTKFLGKLADSGPQVSQRMADMDILATVVRDAPQVPVSDPQIFFDRIGAGLGLSKGELATRSDAMKAIIQRLAPAQREEGSGSTSDIEFKGMLASFPSLATTPEGRQMILTTIARQNEITRMRIEVADQWTQGEIPATEARKRIAQIDRASIYASEDEKKLVRKLAGTAKGGDTGKASPALEREIGGKIYVQRGGQWYVKEGN